jgi:hypothetical protein
VAEWDVTGGVTRPNFVGYPSYALKMARALEHLGSLYASAQLFAESSAFTFGFDKDSDTGEHVAKVTLRSEPPVGIGILAADCIHNLRQALDHLAYQLAILVSGTDPPPNEDTAMFPIYTAMRDGQQVVLDDDRLRTKIGDPAKVPPGMRTILEDLQPYYGGDTLRLAALQDLENVTKHRHLPVCVGALLPGLAKVDGIAVTSVSEGRLEIGETEVARFTMTKDKVYVEGQVQIEVMLDPSLPGSGIQLTRYLHETRDYVLKRVVGPLQAFLYPRADPAP